MQKTHIEYGKWARMGKINYYSCKISFCSINAPLSKLYLANASDSRDYGTLDLIRRKCFFHLMVRLILYSKMKMGWVLNAVSAASAKERRVFFQYFTY
ncbi:hypothetical protein MIDIC_140069 [Alphaproteobacteria bacterium]